ncbi:MAG: putative polymerase sigma (70) factor [Arthrobacter sp.]|nr:putative polymerase sigma (70) factor [Arthrobacter sp.]
MDASVATGRIARTFRSMAPIDQETLLLNAWADLTYEDIASAMDVPVGTVRSRLNSASRTLRTQLNLGLPDETELDPLPCGMTETDRASAAAECRASKEQVGGGMYSDDMPVGHGPDGAARMVPSAVSCRQSTLEPCGIRPGRRSPRTP